MRQSKLTITVTETEQKKGLEGETNVNRKLQVEHNGCVAHMLFALPRFIASLEQSLPEKYQARFRAEFLEELNEARKEMLENEG